MKESKACAEVLEDFCLKIKEEFGIVLSEDRDAYIYVRYRQFPMITMPINFFKDCSDIRVGLESVDKLIIGFSGNCLLTTNKDNFNNHCIEQIHFVSEMFKNEAKWRELLLSLNIQLIIDEEKAKDEAIAIAAEEKRAKELKAFEDANIVVGSEIKMTWSTWIVERMTATRVQIGKDVYDKQEVGAKLLEGVWQVNKR